MRMLAIVLWAIGGCGGNGMPPAPGMTHDGGASDASPAQDDARPVEPGPDAAPATDAAQRADASAGSCAPIACDAAPPVPGPLVMWRNPIEAGLSISFGAPRHRGHDLFLRDGDPQWAIAKLAYGSVDKDLHDEEVEVWVLRGCAGSWEPLGTAITTRDGEHETVLGVDDSGGRVYLEIPAAQRLPIGRHRIHFVVRGDHTTADQYIEVLPADARFVVTDVDGTQTEAELAEFEAVFGGDDPTARPYGAEMLQAYAARGYHVFYLTARPEWLHLRTHEWLRSHGYPEGIVHTTLDGNPAFGTAAHEFKVAHLALLRASFPAAIEAAFGNTDTDESAFLASEIPNDRVFLYQFEPLMGGTRIDDYGPMVDRANAAPLMCR